MSPYVDFQTHFVIQLAWRLSYSPALLAAINTTLKAHLANNLINYIITICINQLEIPFVHKIESTFGSQLSLHEFCWKFKYQ